MLTIKLFGDKQDDRFVWSIAASDSRGTHLVTDGTADLVEIAKAEMLSALGKLVEKLEFQPASARDLSRLSKITGD